MKFSELKEYLDEHAVFGLTAKKRKKTIIYFFRRYYVKIELSLKVKVDRETKEVISVICKDKVYTDFDDIKKLVEKK